MYCGKCGNNIGENNRFCGVCGWDSQSGSEFETAPENVAEYEEESDSSEIPYKKKTNVMLLFVVIIALAVAGVGGWFVYDNFIKKDKQFNSISFIGGTASSEEESGKKPVSGVNAVQSNGEKAPFFSKTLSDGCIIAVVDEEGVVGADCHERLLTLADTLSQKSGISVAFFVSPGGSGIDVSSIAGKLGNDFILIIIDAEGQVEINAGGSGRFIAFGNSTVSKAEADAASAAAAYSDADGKVYACASAFSAALSRVIVYVKSDVSPYYAEAKAVNQTMFVYDVGSAGLFVRSSPKKVGGKGDAGNNLVCYSSTGKPVYLEDGETPFVFFTYNNWAYLEITKNGEVIHGWSFLDYLTTDKPE